MSFLGFDLLDGIDGNETESGASFDTRQDLQSFDETRSMTTVPSLPSIIDSETVSSVFRFVDAGYNHTEPTGSSTAITEGDLGLEQNGSWTTILSSVPSDHDRSMVSPRDSNADVAYDLHDRSSLNGGHLSLSTQESVDARTLSAPSSQLEVSSLSLRPSSVASSLLLSSHLSQNDSSFLHESAVFYQVGRCLELNPQAWFERLQNEGDWDIFRNELLQVLAALEDESKDYPDILLAQLIEREEDLFWKKPEKRSVVDSVKSILSNDITLFMASAALPFLGFVLFCRR